MRILEELWYGNIEPTDFGASTSAEYKELRRLVDRNETGLRATMTDAQKELFTRYGATGSLAICRCGFARTDGIALTGMQKADSE